LIGSTLRNLALERKRAAVASFRTRFLDDFESGKLKPIIDRAFAARSVREAHARMEANQNIGKLILQWE
jgi:NADPH:quinone reductase-like Zn-dependent oxidoreductase